MASFSTACPYQSLRATWTANSITLWLPSDSPCRVPAFCQTCHQVEGWSGLPLWTFGRWRANGTGQV